MKLSLLHWDSGTSPVMNPQTDVVWQSKSGGTERETEGATTQDMTDRACSAHSFEPLKVQKVRGDENSPLMANMAASRGHVKIKWTCWLVSSSGTSHAEMSDTWLAFFYRALFKSSQVQYPADNFRGNSGMCISWRIIHQYSVPPEPRRSSSNMPVQYQHSVQSTTVSPDWNSSTTLGWVAVLFGTVMFSSGLTELWWTLTFHLVPSSCQRLNVSSDQILT